MSSRRDGPIVRGVLIGLVANEDQDVPGIAVMVNGQVAVMNPKYAAVVWDQLGCLLEELGVLSDEDEDSDTSPPVVH